LRYFGIIPSNSSVLTSAHYLHYINHSYLYRLNSLTDCSPHFYQIAYLDGPRKVASHCHNLGGGRDFNLEACKAETMALGGNVFNFHTTSCYVKHCEDVDEPHFTYDHGGWDVYVLQSTCISLLFLIRSHYLCLFDKMLISPSPSYI